jgi:hypothetical protein
MEDKWITSPTSFWWVRGRTIGEDDIIIINNLIKEHFHKGRKHISRQLAHHWKWYQPNGQTKDMACRYILLSLEKEGLIKLPPRLNSANNERRKIEKIELDKIPLTVPLTGTVKNHPSLRLKHLISPEEHKLWNRIIHSYHYQGYQIIVGKFLKYMAYINDMPVACLGWGSAAWSIEVRDNWIGWSKEIKDRNLCGIVNNTRFLILPWVKIKYLASYLLGMSVVRIRSDWEDRYSHPIYLLETFVEQDKFQGTCYKAANWQYLGQTKGNAKRGNSHIHHGKVKNIFAYPLCEDFRDKLKGEGDNENTIGY